MVHMVVYMCGALFSKAIGTHLDKHTHTFHTSTVIHLVNKVKKKKKSGALINV